MKLNDQIQNEHEVSTTKWRLNGVVEWNQIKSARRRVPRIFQKNDLCNKTHFCSVLERLKRTNQSHGTLFEFDCYFCWLIINPCKEALKSISCYRTLSILRFVIEILRHLRKILNLRHYYYLLIVDSQEKCDMYFQCKLFENLKSISNDAENRNFEKFVSKMWNAISIDPSKKTTIFWLKKIKILKFSKVSLKCFRESL